MNLTWKYVSRTFPITITPNTDKTWSIYWKQDAHSCQETKITCKGSVYMRMKPINPTKTLKWNHYYKLPRADKNKATAGPMGTRSYITSLDSAWRQQQHGKTTAKHVIKMWLQPNKGWWFVVVLGILPFSVTDTHIQCRFWQEWGIGYEACVNPLRFILARNIVWLTCHLWVEGDISALWLGFELLVCYMMVLYIWHWYSS